MESILSGWSEMEGNTEKNYMKMEAKNKIHTISKELIKPSSPTPLDSKDLKPSFLDQILPSMFIPVLFFYQKQNQQPPCSNIDIDPSTATLHLKQSLSESLTKFYPLAGKLQSPDLVSVDCDDSGVLFVEARVDATLSESVHHAPFEIFGQCLPFVPKGTTDVDDDDEKQLLAVKITWFECGSNVIGVCISHKVADFMSLVTFMNSWAALNRGENTHLPMPNFDLGRHLFPPSDFPVSSFPMITEKKKIVCKRFVFNKEKITELKELAISSSLSSPSLEIKDPTRVEVVTAFLWKHFINVARAKNHNPAMLFRMLHAMNLRSRMSSLVASSSNNDVHEFPFGNLSIPVTASFTPDENQDDSYGDLVWLTSDAFRKVNEDYILTCIIPSLESLARTGIAEMTQQPTTMVRDCGFTSWCRFPTYEVDFGWGKPVSVGPAGTPTGSGIILTSTRNEEGIEAWISMSEEDLALLPNEFLSLAATDFFHLK